MRVIIGLLRRIALSEHRRVLRRLRESALVANIIIAAHDNRNGEKKAELMKWASHWHEQANPDAEGTKAP